MSENLANELVKATPVIIGGVLTLLGGIVGGLLTQFLAHRYALRRDTAAAERDVERESRANERERAKELRTIKREHLDKLLIVILDYETKLSNRFERAIDGHSLDSESGEAHKIVTLAQVYFPPLTPDIVEALNRKAEFTDYLIHGAQDRSRGDDLNRLNAKAWTVLAWKCQELHATLL